MSMFIAAQIIGAVAVLLSIGVYQFNRRTTMLQFGMASALLFGLSFCMLKAYTGAVLNVLGAIRCYAYYRVVPGKQTAWVFWLFAALSAIATFLTWGGPQSVLALAGTLLYGLAEWQKSPRHIRRLSILGPPVWFAYNFITRSYPGMFVEVFVLLSNVVGQYRFDRKRTVSALAKSPVE